MISYKFAILFSAIPSLLFLVVFIFNRIENLKFKDKIKSLEKENDSLEIRVSSLSSELVSIRNKTSNYYKITKGSKGLVHGYGLEWTATKKAFKVDYEVDILDVTSSKVKVSAFDFTSNDTNANDPKNKTGVLSHLQNHWIDISKVSLIINESAISRDKKLDIILNS